MEINVLFAKISWFLIIIILYMRPLADIFHWKFMLKAMRFRKQLGIACGISAILHVSLYLSGTGLVADYFSNPVFWSWNNFLGWGSFALAAMMFPLLTSNKFSLRLFKKNWKRIQRMSYAAFIATGMHIAMIRGDWIGGMLPVFVWMMLWLMAWQKKSVVLAEKI